MVDWELFYNRLRTPGFLPGYEIQGRLGGGAFGDVYKAEKQSIGKVYAVKFLKVSEEDVVLRELEHVSYFAAIDHPNLVTIEDVGVVLGVPYVLMGYAGEDTLARGMKRGDIDRESMVRYFVQACRGVLALHDRRLAHFDLKPSNIFIKGDVARVGDYGLSKLLSDGRQTLSFGRGTPHYMAPEMLKNRADHRADIYSLGIILYEGLAGRLPFGLSSETILREDDDPPEFGDDFPTALRGVVECATRLDPEQRYWSVLEILEEMGQTARQGDSVRFGTLLAAPSPAPARALLAEGTEPSSPTAPGDAGRPIGPGELRRTAAEFARGAVGVARGVWDGVVARSSEVLGTPSGADSSAEIEAPADIDEFLERENGALRANAEVVSIQTLDEPEGEAAPRRGGLLALLARERALRDGASDKPVPIGAALGAFRPWDALPAGALTAGRTVPVPPRAEGGVAGAFAATVALGFEVMVALVSGPILYVLRGVGRGVDRVLRFVPGALGSVLKLVLFLVLLAVLGAVLAALGLMFFVG